MSLFRWGLVLFLCCDICVGAFQQGDMLPAALRAAAGFGMWTFYLPGQVLISLSTGEVGGNHEGK
jgi:hypothetical protein